MTRPSYKIYGAKRCTLEYNSGTDAAPVLATTQAYFINGFDAEAVINEIEFTGDDSVLTIFQNAGIEGEMTFNEFSPETYELVFGKVGATAPAGFTEIYYFGDSEDAGGTTVGIDIRATAVKTVTSGAQSTVEVSIYIPLAQISAISPPPVGYEEASEFSISFSASRATADIGGTGLATKLGVPADVITAGGLTWAFREIDPTP